MRIGFDAKRAFHNKTGLGNYSRGLIHALAEHFPDESYYLYNPKPADLFHFNEKNIKEINPSNLFYKKFKALWRSYGMLHEMKKNELDFFHGLSHEIPYNIHKSGIKSVVTIHDLITFRFPKQFSKFDAMMHQRKIGYACNNADVIIAISEQTKRDIIEFLNIDPAKIKVCYQHCDTKFSMPKSDSEKSEVLEKLGLPKNYFLYVGSIIERKNLLRICEAMKINEAQSNLPLVVVGNGGKYKDSVKSFIQKNDLNDRIIFLSDVSNSKTDLGQDLPELYQSATALIYPSEFEGFGIPVLEALWSGTPVITSSISCLPEAGGPGSYYVDPKSATEIATAMLKIESDESMRKNMIATGKEYALNFTPKKSAENIMKIYQSLL
jgi:glycosyltransferase involved in cell wall biosynthesis